MTNRENVIAAVRGEPVDRVPAGFWLHFPEDCFYGEGVCLIEWPSRILEILPDRTTWVEIAKDLEKGFDYRRIRVEERA